MEIEEKFMQLALNLALKGRFFAHPNPLVGSVIVEGGDIIGAGYHQEYGKAHAEVNAINSVLDKSRLSNATIYVTLEPCSHFGKTPPCADLIINSGIKRVVIATKDNFSLVNGKGIDKLIQNGIEVKIGVLEKEAQFLNRKFFTSNKFQRPYITLKFAQTKNLVIGTGTEERLHITSAELNPYLHALRAENMGILVGATTFKLDNPKLDIRHSLGRNPTKIILDRNLINQYEGLSEKFLIYNDIKSQSLDNREFIKIESTKSPLDFILKDLFQRGIKSVLVEGGKKILDLFIENNQWDEAFMITNQSLNYFPKPEDENLCVYSPKINGNLHYEFQFKNQNVKQYLKD